jgi:hypothetical protein
MQEVVCSRDTAQAVGRGFREEVGGPNNQSARRVGRFQEFVGSLAASNAKNVQNERGCLSHQ